MSAIKRTQEPFASAKPITNETKRPVPAYFWSRDGKYVLYIQDKGGDEKYNIYAVNPSESPAAGEDVPKARNLTDLKSVRVAIYELPKNEPDTIYIGLNDRDAAWHDLYRLTISTGERTLLRKNTDRLTGWVLTAKAAAPGDPIRRQWRYRSTSCRSGWIQEGLFMQCL
jgi:Tol biopolymer transport system component